MANSRNYTLLSLMGLIRLKSGKLQNTLLSRPLLIDLIYTSLLEVARELKEMSIPEFGATASITDVSLSTATGSFSLADIDGSLTKINVESITKLVGEADNTEIIAVLTDATEYNYLSDYPQAEDDVFWYRDGEIIYMFKGSDITLFDTAVLHYNRIPEKAILDATYIDLSDRFIPLLIEKVLGVVK